MARTKQHPDIGRFTAFYQGEVDNTDERPVTYDTPEEALESLRKVAEDGMFDDGTVIYVYAIVGVKTIRKPTLTENLSE